MNTVPGATCATFEADLYFDKFSNDATITQFNIGSAYMFHITTNKTTGDVQLCALTAGSDAGRVWGKGITLGAQRTWIHLRIDVFTGDFNSTLAKVYVDDELVLVTNNYKGYRNNTDSPVAPSSDVSKAYFYTYTAGNGTIYLDNVSFEHNTTPRGNDEITDPRPAYVPPVS